MVFLSRHFYLNMLMINFWHVNHAGHATLSPHTYFDQFMTQFIKIVYFNRMGKKRVLISG